MDGGNRLESVLIKQLEFGRQGIKEEKAMQGGEMSQKNGRLESVDTQGILDDTCTGETPQGLAENNYPELRGERRFQTWHSAGKCWSSNLPEERSFMNVLGTQLKPQKSHALNYGLLFFIRPPLSLFYKSLKPSCAVSKLNSYPCKCNTL